MKKLIAIVIAFIVIRYLLLLKASQDQANEEAQLQAQEENNRQQEEKQEQALAQINVNNVVNKWYQSYNSYLPVNYADWVGFTEIPYQNWPQLKKAMSDIGYTYKEVYERILYWSSSICHTGFYKSEFDPIRDKLAERANW